MAQTEHLPIYKSTYDLCLYLEQIVHSFSRYHKYTLGADLRDGARRALRLVVRANARRDKVPVLLQLREGLEELVEIYGWFTEGFDTVDLKEAKALLENLTEYEP